MAHANTPVLIKARKNGAGAAAVLSAALGSLTLGVLTFAADKYPVVKNWMIFYKPTGALSGVTSLSIATWLILWLMLHLLWTKRDLPLRAIVLAALGLLAVSLLLTFPPFIDLL